MSVGKERFVLAEFSHVFSNFNLVLHVWLNRECFVKAVLRLELAYYTVERKKKTALMSTGESSLSIVDREFISSP